MNNNNKKNVHLESESDCVQHDANKQGTRKKILFIYAIYCFIFVCFFLSQPKYIFICCVCEIVDTYAFPGVVFPR